MTITGLRVLGQDLVYSSGHRLVADVSGIADADGLGALQFQWFQGRTAIWGATEAIYQVRDDPAPASISVTVSWTDGLGKAEALSATPPEGAFRANPLVMHGTVQGDRLFGERDPRTFKGMGGDDTIIGSWGDDQAFGGPGADRLNMGHGHDLAYGGAHSDMLMGGTGWDRLHGGAGSAQFYHVGVRDHFTDWVQDYRMAAGDRLVFGGEVARIDQFQVNISRAPGAGQADVAEAFVLHRPIGQILWALVDGGAQSQIWIEIDERVYGLL